MKVVFHPGFPEDVKRYRRRYEAISARLGSRFSGEVRAVLESIKNNPTAAGHFLRLESAIISDFRRANLASFPFFILYGIEPERVIVGSLIAARSDPMSWLNRFRK